MNSNKKELFESRPINKALLSLAIPTIISSLVMIVYSLADTYFVGMINIKEETAAVTLASTVLLAFNAVNNLFGVGGSSLISRALGAKDYDVAHKTSAFCFYMSIFSGLMFSLLATIFMTPLLNLLGADASTFISTKNYLFYTVTLGAIPSILNVVLANLVRSEGYSLQASIGTMSGCLLNIVLDPIFILFFDLKAAGAGLATLISNCFACLYLISFIIIQRKETVLSLSFKDLSFNSRIVGGVFGVGFPASIQNLLNVTGQTLLNSKAAVYGAAAVAAMGIDHRVCMIPLMITMGTAQGVMPLISYNYASGNYKRMKEAIGRIMIVSITFLIFLTAFYYFGSEMIMRVFIKDAETIALGSIFIKLNCICLIFLGIDFNGVGVFQATGKGMMSLIFAILRKIVLEIPLIIILDKLFPLYGMAFAQSGAEIILAIAALIYLRSFFVKLKTKESNQVYQ